MLSFLIANKRKFENQYNYICSMILEGWKICSLNYHWNHVQLLGGERWYFSHSLTTKLLIFGCWYA